MSLQEYRRKRRFDRTRKGERIGDRGIARDAARKSGRLRDRRAGHQPVNALVHIAETLFEADDGFAGGGKTEMTRLDDAGMYRPDRNLV